jgi:hypothetical protein
MYKKNPLAIYLCRLKAKRVPDKKKEEDKTRCRMLKSR